MVSETGDIPDRSDVKPDHNKNLLVDILEGGEAIVTLENGNEYELHGYDTYFFREAVYTKDGEDDVWFYKDSIVDIRRHHD